MVALLSDHKIWYLNELEQRSEGHPRQFGGAPQQGALPPRMKTPTRAEFDASEHGKLLSRLAQRIAKLPRMPRELLAMYYYEALPVPEIAAYFGLPEYQIEETRLETVDLLRVLSKRNVEYGQGGGSVNQRAQQERCRWINLVLLEDLELVRECRAGVKDAFSGLVSRYRSKVYTTVHRSLKNEQDAWDLTQEIFLEAWNSIHRFKGKSSFSTWLYQITRCRIIDFIRKSIIMVEFDHTRNHDLYFNSPMPNEQLDNAETLRRVEAAIARLSPQHRTVLELHAMDNLSCEEVAKRLACSIGTVLSRLFYARKRLKDILKRAL